MKKKLTIFIIAGLVIIWSMLLCSCGLFDDCTTQHNKPTEIPFEIVTRPIAKSDLVYNERTQVLLEPGEVVGGRIEYWLEDSKPYRYDSYKKEVPTGKNAGEYKVHYRLIPDDSNQKPIEELIICTIGKAQPIIIEEPQPLPNIEYGKYGSYLVTKGEAKGGKYVFSKTKDGEFKDLRQVSFYGIGPYTIYYKIKGDENHLDSEVKSTTNTIYPRKIDFTDPSNGGKINIVDERGRPIEEEYFYTGEEIKPKIAITCSSSDIDSSEYEVLYENNIDAGTAKIIIRDVEGGNYIVSGEREFTIQKMPFSDEHLPKAIPDLVYNGTPQTLVTNETAEGLTFLYSKEQYGEGAYTEELPNGTEAGNYKIWYKVVGDKNHEGKERKSYFYASIAKASATGTECTAIENLVYSGNAQVLLNIGTLVGGKFLFSLEQNGPFLETVPTGTDAGTYKVYIKKEADNNHFVENDNYFINTTIGKAESSVTIVNKTLTYSGEDLELISTNNIIGGSLQYKICDGEYSHNIPKAKQAGEYHVFYKLLGDSNHTDIEEKEVVCKIDPKEIKIASTDIILSDDVFVYTGSEITPTVGDIKDGALVIPTSEYEIVYENNINAGNATVKINDVVGGNYLITGTKTFTIEKASITLELAPAPTSGNIYDGSSKTLIVPGRVAGGEPEQTLEYKIAPNGTYTKNMPSAIEAGEYQVYYQVPEGKNHKGIAEAFVTTKIFDVTYTLCADGKSYSADGPYDISLTEVTIPSTYNNLPIVAIGANAFRNCTLLTKIVMPASIITIGDNAFSNCSSLTKLVIPDAVTTIGSDALLGCDALITLTSPTITLASLPDQIKTNLTTVILTSGTEIKAHAFDHFTSLTKLVIPDSVTTIGNEAFNEFDLRNLQEVSCPALAMPYINDRYLKVVNITSGTELPKNAFTYKGPLDKLVIADSVQSIHAYAFPVVNEEQGYVVIKELIVPETCLNIVEKLDKTKLQTFTLTNGTILPANIFSHFSNLTTVNLPDTLQSIEHGAFYGCTALEEIIVPKSVTSIGVGVFTSCDSLMRLSLPFLGETLDSTDHNFLGYIFGASVSEGANNIPLSLKNLSIARGKIATGSIGRCSNDPYCYNNNLISVTIGRGVTEIGANAFVNCKHLSKVYITDMDAWLKIIFNDNPLIIGRYLYLNGDEVTTLNISGIDVPANAFSGCKSLKTITIGDNITLGTNAFADCTNITSLAIGNNVTLADNTFWKCSKSLQTITLGENATYKLENGCLINKVDNTLLLGSSNVTTIPNGVITIGDYAFYDCALEAITIPHSVTKIANYAFYGCHHLNEVTIGTGVTSIGYSAFAECKVNKVYIFDLKKWCEIQFKDVESNPLYNRINGKLYLEGSPLSEIVIPKGITTLQTNTFQGAGYLTKISIGNDVKVIEPYALAYCKNLSEVIIDNTVSKIGWYAFEECTSITKLVVPFIGREAVAKDTTIEEDCQQYYNLAYLFTQDTINNIGFGKLALSVTGETKIISNALKDATCLKEVHLSIKVTQVEAEALNNTAKYDHEFGVIHYAGVHDFFYEGTIEQWQDFGIAIDNNKWLTFECIMYCSNGYIRYGLDENGYHVIETIKY